VAVAKPEPVDEADGDAIVKLMAKTVRSHLLFTRMLVGHQNFFRRHIIGFMSAMPHSTNSR
jgi:hypothetical protein